MGGLGHYFESEGIASTQISLVRVHTENIKPPRALWVPFELGRPFGVPNDSDFQLYNLKEDIEQQNNLAPLMPSKLQEMLTAFEAIRGEDYGEIEKLELK